MQGIGCKNCKSRNQNLALFSEYLSLPLIGLSRELLTCVRQSARKPVRQKFNLRSREYILVTLFQPITKQPCCDWQKFPFHCLFVRLSYETTHVDNLEVLGFSIYYIYFVSDSYLAVLQQSFWSKICQSFLFYMALQKCQHKITLLPFHNNI